MVVFVLVPAILASGRPPGTRAIRTLLIQATHAPSISLCRSNLALLALGYPFLALWMGPEYAAASYATLVAYPASSAFRHGHGGRAGVQGIGKVRPLAVLTWDPTCLIDPCTLAFDIDGVVADTMAVFVRLAHEKYGTHPYFPAGHALLQPL